MERPYTKQYHEDQISKHLSNVIKQINIEQFKQLSKKLNSMDTDTS